MHRTMDCSLKCLSVSGKLFMNLNVIRFKCSVLRETLIKNSIEKLNGYFIDLTHRQMYPFMFHMKYGYFELKNN